MSCYNYSAIIDMVGRLERFESIVLPSPEVGQAAVERPLLFQGACFVFLEIMFSNGPSDGKNCTHLFLA